MKLIAALSANWGIGLDGKLLFQIPDDLRRFRALTTGGTLVMGRKTMDTLPGGVPLPRRKTVVLSRNPDYRQAGAAVVHSVEELRSLRLPEPVFVAGGGEIYRLLLPWCDEAYLTRVDACPPANVFFPRLDRDSRWRLVEQSEKRTWQTLSYRFCQYRKDEEV